MSSDDPCDLRDHIDKLLKALETGDAVAAASTYVRDGVFIHPQYPETEYRGRETIREAFDRGLTNIVGQPAFTIRTVVADGDSCAVEVDARYVSKDCGEFEVPQLVIVEGSDAGIVRWRTYLPFAPG